MATQPKGTIIVTGANGGLGSALVTGIGKNPKLSSPDYISLYTVRKKKTASDLDKALQGVRKNSKHEVLELDLSTIAAVKAFAASINERVEKGDLPPIRALILNAGFQEQSTLTKTSDGLDMTWQVNYLANFILCLALLQSMDREHGRIVLIGSWTHDMDDKRNELSDPWEGAKWKEPLADVHTLATGQWSNPDKDPHHDPTPKGGYRRYAASKLCVVMFLVDLAKRLSADQKLSNISVLSVDPGAMQTGLFRRNGLGSRIFLGTALKVMSVANLVNENSNMRPPWRSAQHVLRAAFDYEPPKGQPVYFSGSKVIPPSKETRDEELQAKLWQYALTSSKLNEGDTLLADWK